jgi:glycosyltransferase involved in cell wall biosynthesis
VSQRLRIAQMVSGRVVNGAVRHCLMLCEALAARGHEVILCHRPQLDVGELVGPRVERLPTTFPLNPLAILAFGRELRRRGVQVMHTHTSDAHTYGAVIRTFQGLTVVATAHSSHFQLHWAFNDRVIAPSAATAAFHRRVNRVSPRRLVVIPNFIDAADRLVVTARSRTAARARIGLAEDALVIGCVGEINSRKRQSDLADAVTRMTASPPAELVLVGAEADAGEAARVTRAAPLLGVRLHRLGARQDVAELLPAFDVFALASRAEEMPIAILEAMAAGLPVIATRVGGVPEMVAEAETGLLVPAADIATMTAALDRLAADPDLRQEMGQAGRARAEAEFAPGPIVTRVEAVLAEAVADRSAAR